MAEGVAGAVEAAPKAAGSFFTHKLGPLPVWAWGLGIGGIIAAVLWYENQSNGAVSGGLQNALGAAGIGAPLDTGSAASPETNLGATSTPLTNATWLQQVLTGAANAAGVPLSQAQLYLQDYLNGTPPNLSGAAETAYQSVISNALALGGSAPSVGVAPAGTNPFGSNQTWFNEILSFLPSGTFEGESASQIQQGLTNWINGLSTTLTQAEADALAQSQTIVGSAPNPVTFSIAGAASAAGSLTQAAINTWQNAFLSLPAAQQTYQTWVQNAPAALTSALNPSQLQNLYGYLNSAAGKAAVSSEGALGVINGAIANPTGIPPASTAPTVSGSPVKA